MVQQKASHKHPDSEQRIKALEKQCKKLETDVRDLQKKLQTHDHPHDHPHTH
jgi:chaperonin cofactor prefoldin